MSGGDYKYVNPPKLGIPSWGELLDKGSNSIILGEIGENLENIFYILIDEFIRGEANLLFT